MVMLVNTAGQPLTRQMMWLTGFVDGDPSKGKVSYLSGHRYQTKTPISGANNTTNGTRLFLNSLYESPCTSLDDAAPILTINATAPAATNSLNLTYTLTSTNVGQAFGASVQLVAPLPAGTAFVSASNGGTASGGNVNWSLGPLDPNATFTITMTVHATADGNYSTSGTVSWFMGL